MGKYTPGPWKMYNTDYGVGVTSKHSDVAICRDNYNAPLDSRRKPEEDIANACLMAAAPDMISALRAILAVSERRDGPAWNVISDTARAGINKAEGFA